MSDDPETLREEIFKALSQRLSDETFEQYKEHFNEHLEEGDGPEQAYSCLVHALIDQLDHANEYITGLVSVVTGKEPTNQ